MRPQIAIVLVSGLLLSSIASAHIPNFWMIMSRTAENHGKGPYMIEQDVVFQHGPEPQIINEKWIVENDESMRLVAVGRRNLKEQLRMTAVYDGRTRYFVDGNGVKKSLKLGKDWFEPFFYFRFSAKIKPLMHSLQMIPAAGLQMPAKVKSIKEIKNDPEPYVRLSRIQGKVAYGIGVPSPANSDGYPGMWIEQDAFNVLKIRLPNQVVVRADKYNQFSKDFWLPRFRDVDWGANRTRINVIKVTSLAPGTNLKSQLSMSSLDFGKDPNIVTTLPSDPVISEFYSRFR